MAGSSGSPSLGTGTTSAIFHALGKESSLKELLINLVITGTVNGQLSFKTLAEILSKPGALLLHKLLTTDSASFSCSTDLLGSKIRPARTF